MGNDKQLRILSGGAAQGLVSALASRFGQQTGFDVQGSFGAVGGMRDRLLAGEACDVVILSQALVEQLAAQGHVLTDSLAPLGIAQTGLAVNAGEALPSVSTPAQLEATLRAASGIYFPDPAQATAGIHFMKVLRALGLDQAGAGRLHAFPNGPTAMHAMAQAPERGAVGCTQKTEILATPGVQWAGPLPGDFALATVYTAAVCTRAAQPDAARMLVRLLAGHEAAPQRATAGFDPLSA